MRVQHLVILVLGILCVGCSQTNTRIIKTPTLITPTELPTVTTTVQASPIISTYTPMETQTEIIGKKDENINQIPECTGKGQIEGDNQTLSLEDSLLYQVIEQNGLYELTGDLSDSFRLLYEIPADLMNIGFSPDGKWLAYLIPTFQNDQNSKTAIIDSITAVLISVEGEERQFSIDLTPMRNLLKDNQNFGIVNRKSYWINQDAIYVGLMYQNSESKGPFFETPIIFYPFTESWTIDIATTIPGWQNGFYTQYSHDLSNVIYEYHNDESSGINLYSLANKQITFQDKNIFTGYGSFFSWSWDDQYVVYGNENWIDDSKIVLLSSDGQQVKQLSEDIIPGYFNTVAWSADNKFLAISTSGNSLGTMIYLYDNQKSSMTLRCNLQHITEIQMIKWSPDGKKLAIEGLGSEEEDWARNIYLYDTVTGRFYKVISGAKLVGWYEGSLRNY